MDKMTPIEFSEDHMLILFDLVARLNAAEHPPTVDQAEQRVLWDLEAELERRLAAVVAPDYRVQVEAARKRVRDADT